MIVIREVFVARPGMASKLAKLFSEAMKGSPDSVRVMTDMVGPFNTVVIETELESMSAIEKRMQEYASNQEIRKKMAGYTDLWTEGRREVYQVVG